MDRAEVPAGQSAIAAPSDTSIPETGRLRSALDHELSIYGEDAILRDGRAVRLRAVSRTDQQLVGAFFERLTPQSRHSRFFGARSSLPAAEIERMTSLDPAATVAIAAVVVENGEQRIVGIAEFTLDSNEPVTGAERDAELRRGEFAVAVADDQQGRGIGTLLLERVAAVAREAGIDELEALVLADNHQMIDVLERSGFALHETDEAGVRKIVFSTIETEALLKASVERERLAARESVRVFFEPRSVAVVGASRRKDSIGRAVLENLLNAGFRGPVYAVNPNAQEIGGVPAFPSLSAIGEPVDLVVIAVPAKHVEDVVAECAAVRARGVVVLSAGFGESSAEGRAAEARLRHMAQKAGMRLVGPNCMGVLNATRSVSLNATFAPVWPPAGNVSMLSQSGALGIAMLDYASTLNIGLAGFVSVGNKADVSSNDLLSYWADDPNTRVIVLYLESFGNAWKFARLAPEVSRKKPIVAVKSGRSAAGTRAAASHSAALASLDVGIDALFAQAGVIRSNTLEELFDVVSLLSTQPLPRGPRVGVVTNAGGPGILLADACEARGLTLPRLSEPTLAALRQLLPPQAGLSNPIDMIASATPAQFEQTIALVGRDPNVDSVVVIYIPPFVTNPEDVARAIGQGAGAVPADKPVVTVFMSSKGAPAVLAQGPRGKLPSYSFPENAAMALAAARSHALFCERPRGKTYAIPRELKRGIRRIIDRALRRAQDGAVWLGIDELSAVLDLAGIPFAPTRTSAADVQAAAAAAEEMGFPVALKAQAKGLVHKSDVGGVALNLRSTDEVLAAAASMMERLASAGYSIEQFVLQRQIDGGIEALVGVTCDSSLGPVVVVGLGGVQVELLGDAAFRLPPISDVDAKEMLSGLKASKVFDGFRGAPPADRDALVEVVCRVSALVEIVPEIRELDLNPIKVLTPGGGAVAVDGRLRVGPHGYREVRLDRIARTGDPASTT
ncbi:MAG TPA: GNAT family N-acetyltransferase [Polyangiaceae bacterium]|nr:GNAT family N-acetyltransferase [Polyangiaceae bacterium]